MCEDGREKWGGKGDEKREREGSTVYKCQFSPISCLKCWYLMQMLVSCISNTT